MGKTTVAFEVSRRLEEAGVAHALIDTDELDRIYPAPTDDPHKISLAKDNLAAIWANFLEAGAERLILTMTAVSLKNELPHLREAVPGADFTVVRLRADEDVLSERLRRREIGTGAEEHIRRSIAQSRMMDRQPGDGLVIETSGRSIPDVAGEVISHIGWLTR